jgi:dipeptidyl aminopeptidase/acylaminoacyl peptidase
MLMMPFTLSLALSLDLQAQTTPIIDRDLFFGNPEISGGQLSPDGQWISFMKAYEGIMNIWVKKFDEPFEAARPLTDSKRPLYGYFWTDDGKYILYVKDKDGDENINVFAVDPMAKASAGAVPESRNLTPLDDVRAQIYNVSINNPDLMMIGLNDRDPAWHDLYQLEISTGKRTLIYENNDRIVGYDFDWDDHMRLLYRMDDKGNTTILRINNDKSLSPIYETNVSEQAGVSGWNEDNSKMYLITNKGDLDLLTLYLMDPITGAKTLVESDPEGRVDFGGLGLDRDTRQIAYTSYTDDRTRYYWRDKKREELYNYLKAQFPGREVSFQSVTRDQKKFLISVWGDRFASDSYFFDSETRDLVFQYTPRPKLKEVEPYLAPMTPIRYKSSDGLEIPGYLTIPQGSDGKNLPLVVVVHGGPKGPRDYWGYNAEAQFLANRGYAVLQPNFRASGGYGKAFMNAGDLQWGLLMQDDITWGVKHLIDQGIADPKRVAIMGGSYGGYATLAGLAFTPDLYAAGVDIVGPSNIFTLLESVPAYWEPAKAYLYAMTGDPNTEEGRKRIKDASPLFHVDKINRPLLIIQGANDPRVKQAEADQIVIALRDKGKEVSYLLAEDEGHGFAKPVNRMAMYAEVERFLAGVLQGRYQKDMPEEVAQRLEALRVDPATVVYVPKEEVASASTLPPIQNTWRAGSTDFSTVIEVQGQTIPMAMTRTITEKDGHWIVREESSGMMGQSVDEASFSADFRPLSRGVQQMGQDIRMQYAADKVTISAMGQNMEVSLPGAYITDGPGADLVIGGLPLAEGFRLLVDMPDMMTLKAKQVEIAVTGIENVGSAACFVVKVANTDNSAEVTTYWIDQASRSAAKIEQIIPAMGNAKLTTTRK